MHLSLSEFWTFLNGYYNLKTKQGLLKLEIYLEQTKLQHILDFQKRTAHTIKLKAYKQAACFINQFVPKKDNTKLIQALNDLVEIIEELKSSVDLKENLHSLKYEEFIQRAKQQKEDKCITSYSASKVSGTIENIEVLKDGSKNAPTKPKGNLIIFL